jgi:hypothetical protein
VKSAALSGPRHRFHFVPDTWVTPTTWEKVPQPVRYQAKRSFMNLFAVALAGCRTEPVEIALSSLPEFSGGKQATLIGRGERIDALSAAFLNAAAANVHDFCDTHLRTVIHPTAPVAPACGSRPWAVLSIAPAGGAASWSGMVGIRAGTTRREF